MRISDLSSDVCSSDLWSEINMVPISYRASPVFYVQTARFIVYDADPDIVTIMAPTRQADLTNRVAALHGFGGSDPSPQRIREQLEARDNAGMFGLYESRSEENTSELQSLMRISYAVFCLQKKT